MKKENKQKLDSLVDIVSNSVGILVILAVITVAGQKERVYDVDVPLEHESDLTPIFFICKDDAVVHLSEDSVFAVLAIAGGDIEREAFVKLNFLGLEVRYRDSRENALSEVELRAESTEKWTTLSQLADTDTKTDITEVLNGMEPNRQFAYFFVYDTDEAFAVFEYVRSMAGALNIQAGWRPVSDDHPAIIGFYSNLWDCVYRPS